MHKPHQQPPFLSFIIGMLYSGGVLKNAETSFLLNLEFFNQLIVHLNQCQDLSNKHVGCGIGYHIEVLENSLRG